MALIEVDETQWRSATQVVGAMEKLLASPKTRRKVLEAHKELNPNASIPEIDALQVGQDRYNTLEKLVLEQKAALDAEREARAEEKRAAELNSRWDAGRARLRRSGWSDEGIEKVEKFMQEKLVADHEVAAAAYEKMNPAPAPMSPAGNRFDLFSARTQSDDKATQLLLSGQEDAFLASVIPQTLTELRSGR